MFNIKDKVLFDDNKEFIITSKVNCANSNYYMLLERKNFSNVLFCYENNEKLNKLSDKVLITKLLPLFAKASLTFFEE